MDTERPRHRYKEGYTRVPNTVLADMRLTLSEKAVYALLLSHDYGSRNGASWPSVGRLAALAGLGRRRMQALLRGLASAGLVVIEERSGMSNRYHLRVRVGEKGDVIDERPEGERHAY
ncbi:MAG: helix-turn-helix domain-containing protein [Anaerolineae bacterium]